MMRNVRRYFLVDANVLLDYYTRRSDIVYRVFQDIEDRRYGKVSPNVTVFIPTLCISEVFKRLASMCFDTFEVNKLNRKEYDRVRLNFSNDISRTDHWGGIDDKKVKENQGIVQKYYQLELTRYHILNAHYIYPFVPKAQDREKKKFLSGIDVLVIAQAMEQAKMVGRDAFAVLTSDKKMIELGKVLQGLSERELRECGLQTAAKDYFPIILDARDFAAYEAFLKT